MRGIKRYISRNWIWIVIGMILTEVFVEMAYKKRGYWAFGGEWLTLPLILMVMETVRNVRILISYLFRLEDDCKPGRD